ncbi:energy transducer TonB [Sphingobacterium siyangense]|uniref:energy transducer TonB n=1 Tax=Sphingobacterium siyangense TaxID=459529 RepID=UPI00200E3F58|nr:energy transducer TonB [Sphingobacterium siyangense]UQA76505.1 energy transducer TonB [Sphingobacterium siyangense]
MKRLILVLIVLVLIGANTEAFSTNERGEVFISDTIVNYFDKSGNSVGTKLASHSYQCIVPVGDESNRFFNIVSYYTDTDSMKSFAYSRDSTVGVFGWKYIGESTTYYPNGQLKSLEKFDTNGSAIDSSYYYYPTGKLKMLVTQVESGQNPFTGGAITKPYYLLYLDSLGNYLLKRGNGFIRLDYDNGDYIEGELKDNEREGKWEGWNMESRYEEQYLAGVLQSGKRFRANGELISYDADTRESAPIPSLKMDQFMKTVSQQIDVPDNLIAQLKSTIIHVKFVVNNDGRLSDFKYDSDIPFEIKKEITAAIQRVGPWKPGRLQGEPVAINYSIPIRL